jgi:hypothetical protein
MFSFIKISEAIKILSEMVFFTQLSRERIGLEKTAFTRKPATGSRDPSKDDIVETHVAAFLSRVPEVGAQQLEELHGLAG